MGLIDQVDRVGKTLKNQLERLSNAKITSVQTSGTMVWINTATLADAEELRDHLRRHGVLVRQNGTCGIMAKPALTCDEQHISAFVSAVSKF